MGSKSELAGCRLILVGSLPPPATGPSVSFEMLHRSLQERGAICAVINLAKKSYSRDLGTNLIRSVRILKALTQYFWKLTCGYRNVYINIAQSLQGFCRDSMLIWLGKAFGARIVVHLRGGNYDNFYHEQTKFVRFLIKITLRQVNRILVLGEGLRAMYAFDSHLTDRIYVVYNGLSIEAEGMAKTIEHLGGNTIHVLYLSNLIETKGYFHVLESIKILRDTYNIKVACTFAGQFITSRDDETVRSAENAKIRFCEYLDKYDLRGQVRFMGAVSGYTKWQLLRDSHFFVLPTHYVNEGQPVSIIEAMAYGCVVITTNYRAIPDLVIDGRTGIFVDYGEPKQIASAIANLCASPLRYKQMSESANMRYRMHFTMSAYLDAIIPHLTEA